MRLWVSRRHVGRDRRPLESISRRHHELCRRVADNSGRRETLHQNRTISLTEGRLLKGWQAQERLSARLYGKVGRLALPPGAARKALPGEYRLPSTRRKIGRRVRFVHQVITWGPAVQSTAHQSRKTLAKMFFMYILSEMPQLQAAKTASNKGESHVT